MNADMLRETWDARCRHDEELLRGIWNLRASWMKSGEIPDLEKDDFLKLILERIPRDELRTSLDIGCGTGRYTLALAPLLLEGVGCDISDRMISRAESARAALRLRSVRFQRLDWENADIDKLGFRGHFDLVFAHRTPAVDSFSSFEKMIACARKHCFVTKPFRRCDKPLDDIFALLKLPAMESDGEARMEDIFSLLWHHGFEPRLTYRQHHAENHLPMESAFQLCRDMARLRKTDFNEEDERIIRGYLSSVCDAAGQIRQEIHSTNVTIDWSVE